MKTFAYILLISISCTTLVFSQDDTRLSDDYWMDRIYFQIEPSSNIKLPNWDKDSRFAYANVLPELQEILSKQSVESMELAFPGMHSVELQNTYRLVFEEEVADREMLDLLAKNPAVNYAELMPKNYPNLIPNDVGWANLWFMNLIQAPEAWDILDPKENVTVAIADDAILFDHEDLEDNVWINEKELNGTANVDDDNNGYIDDIIGWDGASSDNNPSPPSNANGEYFSHGTHVAGTAGAVTNNTRGISAISFNNAKLMMCKGGRDTDAAFVGIWEAFAYAVANDAQIINNSWGRGVKDDGSPPEPLSNTELFLLEEAEDRDIIVVFAAGNENNSSAQPAEHESVIAVAATGNGVTGIQDQKASYSNFGPWVDIAAPGTQILSCVPGNETYKQQQGTSMAAPNVSSLIALMKSHAPQLNKQQIISCLLNSTDNVSSDNPNHTGLLGAGRINVLKAIQCVSEDVVFCDPVGNLSVTDIQETSVLLNWSAVSEADAYEVEIKNEGSSTWYSFDNNPFFTNELPVSGLQACNTYEFRVKSICGQNESNFSAAFSFETSCDTANEEDCLQFQEVYTSFIDGGNCANNPITGSFEVWANEAYFIADCDPGQSYSFGICDGYDPSNWEVLMTVAKVNEDNTVGDVILTSTACQIEFQIPTSEPNPINIVIIVADVDDCGGAQNQTDNGIPVFDCVNECVLTTGLSATNIQSNQATLTWSNNSDADSYTIQARKTSDTDWVEAIGIEDNKIDYTNLSPCAEYEFRVKSVCGSNSSEFSPSFSFKTEGCATGCPDVTSITITGVDDRSANINWPNVTGATSYELSYKHEQSNNWSVQNASTSDYELENLTSCLNYQVRVRAICDSGESEFSDVYDFETECGGCTTPSNVQILAVTNEKAHIVWDQSSTHLSYIIRAKRTSEPDWAEADLSNSTAIYSGLIACTDYEIQLNAICSDGESGFSNSYFFTSRGCSQEPDCTTYGNNANDEWIEQIKIGGIDNTSGSNYGYAFNDQFSNVIFRAGESYDIELTPGFKSSKFNEFWRIWLDANGDGDFDDVGEMVFDNDVATSEVVVSEIEIPQNVNPGRSFMRVAMKYADGANDAEPPRPCESFSYGEVEDYEVTLDNMVATNENQSDPILIYPNPVIDILNIQGLSKDDKISIYNQTGQLVFQQRNLVGETQLDCSHLSNGIYTIEISGKEGVSKRIRKLVKI